MPVLRLGKQLHRARVSLGESLRRVVQRPPSDELLSTEQFNTLLEARVLIEDWRLDYNHNRPHSSLGWMTPAVYADQWRKQPQMDRLS